LHRAHRAPPRTPPAAARRSAPPGSRHVTAEQCELLLQRGFHPGAASQSKPQHLAQPRQQLARRARDPRDQADIACRVLKRKCGWSLRAQHVQPRLGELAGVGGPRRCRDGATPTRGRTPRSRRRPGNRSGDRGRGSGGCPSRRRPVRSRGESRGAGSPPCPSAHRQPRRRAPPRSGGTGAPGESDSPAARTCSAAATIAGEQGAGTARQLTHHELVSGIRRSLPSRIRGELPREHQPDRGPEMRRWPGTAASGSRDPGAGPGGLQGSRGWGGHAARRRPSAAPRHPGVREPLTLRAWGPAGCCRGRPRSATRDHSSAARR
jgi:hypothetical protein